VCWVDAVWGLGYLAPAPPGTTTVLMVHVPRADTPMREALARRPRRILAPSRHVLDAAAREGLPSGGWAVVPNGLLTLGQPPTPAERDRLRRRGPVRIIARAEPHKGIAPLIDAVAAGGERGIEIVLAPAGFEYWPGMQDQVLATCRELAAGTPRVSVRGALPWDAVQPFLAAAACTIIGSTSPETFGLVALEAMSVGTPIVSFDLGNIPSLAGPAASLVPLADRAPGLWAATAGLLRDPALYQTRATAGISRAAAHTPSAVAAGFLSAIGVDAPGQQR
jgi:iron(II)-dependent oxidoreductase